jgi:hypothetical protein
MKKYLSLFVISIIVFIVIGLNIHKDSFIFGLDNMSPFFNSQSIIDKVFSNNGSQFFAYFPMLFILPFFETLKALNIPLWLINQSYLFISLWLGVIGAGYLSKNVLSKFKIENKYSFIFGSLFYLANLCTYWIFNQPNYFFVAAFASIPWLIEWGISILTKRKSNSFVIIFRIIALVLFFQTTINLVSTITYTFSILLIITALSFGEKLTKKDYRDFGIKIVMGIISILILWQAGLYISGNREFVISKLYNHYTSIQSNSMTESITKDLQASGILKNTILNNIVFKNSWVETHTGENVRLFQSFEYYSSIIGLIGFLPFILAIYTLGISTKKDKLKISGLHFLIFIGLVLMSSTLIKLTLNAPLIGEFFRWSASKFWPLLIFPILILATTALGKINKNLVYAIVAILMFIYIFPIFKGELFSRELTVKLPNEYLELDKRIDSNKLYYYIPTPQNLYFYDYSFGYFGSDFVSYLTKGNSQTSGILSYFDNIEEYDSLSSKLIKCDEKTEGLNIIFDTNISNSDSKIKECLDTKYKLISNSESLYIYE